ncbi:MAG: hypothetical protein IPG49_15150 [Proteobacteria bacterium]|jgi:hypothetical protein|nr:hypothetical protein [Pseudomonadota bacterium]
MSNEQQQTPFERLAGELLRDSADSLDAATRSRLTQARHAALEGISARPAWLDFRVLAPGGAVAAAAVVAVLMWTGPMQRPAGETGAFDDIELLADADAYEISQETDLDFIEWAAAMGEQDVAGT